MDNKLIMSIDLGTTSVRCGLVDRASRIVHSCLQPVTIRHPMIGRSEMDPEELYRSVVDLMRRTMHEANVHPSVCLA